jgi:hypothetical protein
MPSVVPPETQRTQPRKMAPVASQSANGDALTVQLNPMPSVLLQQHSDCSGRCMLKNVVPALMHLDHSTRLPMRSPPLWRLGKTRFPQHPDSAS